MHRISGWGSICWVSKMIIPVYGVRERLSVIGCTNDVMGPEFMAQKSKIQSDRFQETFCEAGTLKAVRKTTFRYQISSSARR